MNAKDYFEHAEGLGVLATANFGGKVDAAVYDRPNFIDEQTVAFIMPDHLTHKDLNSNPQAAYLFVESGSRSKGTRLYLTKLREEQDSKEIYALLEKKNYVVPDGSKNRPLFMVYFRIDRVRPLVEDGEAV